MVVSALMQLAIAAPVGALFGAAYGTAIRVGYEIIFPALFGDKTTPQSAETVLQKMDTFYRGVGGLEANAVGINVGIKNALKAMDADSELQELIKKNSNLDSQTITVNLSGTSTQNGDQSQSSLFREQTRGALDRRAQIKKEAEEALIQRNQQMHSRAFKEAESLAGIIPIERLRELVKRFSTDWFNVTWQYGVMTLDLQRELAVRVNTYSISTSKTSVADAKTLVDAQRRAQIKSFGSTKLVIPKAPLVKRKAGQTQILERNNLIKEIAKLGKLSKDLYAIRWKSVGALGRRTDAIKLMRKRQTTLVGLLQRYRF